MDHDPERLSDHAAIDMLLGQTADPHVDPVDAVDDLGPVFAVTQHDVGVRRDEGRDGLWRFQHEVRIGGHELRDRLVRQIVAILEVVPVRVGRQVAGHIDGLGDVAVGGGGQIGAHLVQRAESQVPAARHVEGEQVGVDAHQVVADRIDDLVVDFLGNLRRRAGDDRRDAVLGVARCRNVARRQRCREDRRIVGRVQEGVEQRHLRRRAVRPHDRHRLRDQRMAEAVGGTGEFVADARIDVGVVAVPAMVARVTVGTAQTAEQLVGELLEDDALVVGLVQHLGRLEHLLHGAIEPLRLKDLHMEVVVARPDGVDRCQCEVLVGTAVTGDAVVEKVDERIGVQQQRIARAEEVRVQRPDDIPVDRAGRIVHEPGIGVAEGHLAAVEPGIPEDRVGRPVMLDQVAQRRQQGELRVRGVRLAAEQLRAEALRAVAFPQELTDQLVAAVGLVLVDVGRGHVVVQRHAVLVVAGHRRAGQVRRIVRRRPAFHSRSTDRDGAEGRVLGHEVEAVIEVLAEGHEQDVGVHGIGRGRFALRPQDVGDVARIQPVEDRVDRKVPGPVGRPVVRVRQADERHAGGTEVGIVDVVAGPAQRPVAGRPLAVVVAFGCRPALDQVPQSGQIVGGQAEVAIRHVVVAARVVPFDHARHAVGPVEGDRDTAAADGDHAVCALRRHGRARARQFDHVLRTQGPHDGVVPALATEDDPVCRGQRRDVDDVVLRGPVDGDRAEIEARGREVTDDGDRVAPGGAAVGDTVAVVRRHGQGVDHDLLDVVEFRDHGRLRADRPCHHDLGRGKERRPETGRQAAVLAARHRIDREGLRLGVSGQTIGVGAATAVHLIPAVGGHLHDRVMAGSAEDHVDTGATVEQVGAAVSPQPIAAVTAINGIRASPSPQDIAATVAVEDIVAASQKDGGSRKDIVAVRAVKRVVLPFDAVLSGRNIPRHRKRRRGIQRFLRAEAIDKAHLDPQRQIDLADIAQELLVGMRKVGGKGVPGGARNIGPDPADQHLPLEAEGPHAVHVGDAGRVHREDLVLLGRDLAVRRRRIDDDGLTRRRLRRGDVAVAKAQHLDVRKRVDAVVDQDVRIGAKAGVGDLDAAIVEHREGVLIAVVIEDRDVGVARLAAGHDLADDVHLAGRDGARHHQFEQAPSHP